MSPPVAGEVPASLREFLAQLPDDVVLHTLAHSTGTARLFIELGRSLFTSLRLPARERELAVLAVAQATRCVYVWEQHEPISRAVGVGDTERRAIRDGELDAGAFSDRAGALVAFATQVARGPAVTDEIFEAARRHFTDREILELLQVCGYYLAFGRICTVLELAGPVHGATVVDDILGMREGGPQSE